MAVVSALSLRGIGVRRGDRALLAELDLELREGELLGLVGPNGAGKTTLLRVAGGTLAPDVGNVSLFGEPLANLSVRERARQIGVVPQDIELEFGFRILELVLMGRAPHLSGLGFESQRDVEIARAALARVGIESLADRSGLRVSGGERQLAFVARALAQEPKVLLLDEPTSHLDLRHRVDVLHCVRDFAARGGSALIVSHDLTLAARNCDRLALLAGGRLLALGPPQEVVSAALLERAYGIQVEVVRAEDGTPIAIPRAGAALGANSASGA
jgi:iron complex transport system ATP-binding protein